MAISDIVFFLGYCIVMDFAIQLNDQFFGSTVKINNVVVDTVLSSKLSTFQFFVLQVFPKIGFCRSQMLPQILSIFPKYRFIVFFHQFQSSKKF